MANYDLPTLIDYIRNETGASKIAHVGHSQGTQMGFIGYENPELAAKVNVFIALGPVAWVYNCKRYHLLILFVLILIALSSVLLTYLARLDLNVPPSPNLFVDVRNIHF